jgi:hypothetical protein
LRSEDVGSTKQNFAAPETASFAARDWCHRAREPTNNQHKT